MIMKPAICALLAFFVSIVSSLGAAPQVSIAAANNYFNALPAQTRATIPAHSTGELQAIANGLENDPALIVAYVRNHFRYSPYYGHMKGPHETLMDQAGNDYDLTRLTVELLRAAGHTASFVRGTITYPLGSAANWLGVSSSQVSPLLSEAGIPHNTPSSSIEIERIWVRVNGVNVDPAFKAMTTINGVDIGALMGYNQFQLLSGAGGITGTQSIRNVNAANVESRLQTWTGNLVNQLKTNHANASIAAILGGNEIVPLTVIKSDLAPLTISASGTTFNNPDAKRMHTVQITVGTQERIVNLPDIDGRIFCIGSTSGSAQPAGQIPVRTHGVFSASTLDSHAEAAGKYTFPPVIRGGKMQYISFSVGKLRLNPNTGGSDEISIEGDSAGAFRLYATDTTGNLPPYPDDLNYIYLSTTPVNVSYAKAIHVYVRNNVAAGSYEATLRIVDYSVNRTPEETLVHEIPLFAVVLPNHVMQLKVGSTVIWDDSAVAASARLGNYDFSVAVDHPYAALDGSLADQAQEEDDKRQVFRGSKYVFITQAGDTRWTGRRVSDRLERCQELMNSGSGPEAEDVVLNTLGAFGAQYLTGAELQEELSAGMASAVLFYHHQFAIATREAGYVMNHALRSGAVVGRSGTVDRNEVFSPGSMFGSALEHGSYEQFQDGQSMSTIKALYIANAAGQKIYKVDKTTLSSIRPELIGHGTNALNRFQDRANELDLTYILHQDGSTVQDEWSGSGYLEIYPYGGRGMLIGSGFNYWNPVYGGVSATRAWESQSTRMQRMMREHRRRLLNARYAAMSAEPVDLKTGAYVYSMTEMNVGNAAPPRGLDFQRSYNSDAAAIGGPLGRGWDHNWNSRLESTSDVRTAMGMGRPADAAAWIVAAHTMRRLIVSDANDVKGIVVQAIVAKWAVDRLRDNSVAVKLAGESAVFTRQPDGSFTPPPGSKFTLETNGASGHLLRNRFGTTFTFDAAGKFTGLGDIHNKSLQVVWSGENVSTVTDAYGRLLTFDYGGDSLLDTVTDSTGRSMAFSYFPNGNLQTFTDSDLNVFRYTYNAQNRLQEFRNGENEVVAFNHYDSRGKVIHQDSEGNAAKRWNFFITPFRTVQEDPEGGQTIYEYDRWGRQTAETDALGHRQRFEYNVHNLLTAAVDAKQQRTEFGYDNRLNLTLTRKFKDGLPVETSATYDALNRQDSVTNANGHSITYGHNAFHEREWEEDPDGNRSTCIYYPSAHAAAGQLAAVAVPGENSATHTTEYIYDNLGHPARIDYPDDTSEDFTYDARGDLKFLSDRRNKVWEFHHNNRRQIHREIDPEDGEKISTYNSYGKLLTSTDRNGNTTINTYHPAGGIKDSTNGEQETTVWQYDSRDWRQKVVSPLLHEVESTYYANGWTEKIFDPVALPTHPTAHHFYQPNGNREVVRNALLQNTTFGFDDLDRVETVTDTRNVETVHTLDDAGNTRFLENGRSHEAESVFDKLNRVTDFYTPLRRHTQSAYSPRGLLQTLTEPSNQSATFHYDEVGRVESRTGSLGVIGYDYDDNGNLETVTEGSKTITRQYDDLNRLTLYRNPEGEEIEYRYHPEGQIWKIIYPDKTKIVEYIYDGANRLKTVKDWNNRTTTYNWDDDGRLQSIARANGTEREIAYDAAGRTRSIREISADGKLISYYKFERDPLGRVKHEMRGPRPPPYPTAAQTATFDDDDRLTTFNGQNVTHDDDGNMTFALAKADEWRSFNYDTRNRLTSVDSPTVWENIFDAEGLRVEIRDETVPTKFVVSPGTLPKTLVQINDDGTRRYFVYGLGLLYHIDGGEAPSPTTTTYHYNAQGSTVALSDDSGAAIGRFHYDPYGLVIGKQGITDTIFQFNGHYGIATDPTGLVHLNARFYNPTLKRFMNSDPAGFAGGMNWFAYSAGDPINLFDPLGLGPADSERYTWIDGMQDGIGAAGFFPGLGAIPDGVNGVIYLFRGKWSDAMFSGIAVIPFAGDLVAGARYADKLNDVRKAADGAAEAPIIMGENMNRVQAYADNVGGQTINDFIPTNVWSREANEAWVRQMRSDGREIIDVGPDFGRRAERAEMGITPWSAPYNMERMELNGYQSYRSVFERTGKSSGGVPGLD